MPAVPPGSKILVTGASGYVATYLIQELLDQGYAVRGTVRSIPKNTFLFDKFKSYGNKFELVEIKDYAKEGAFDEVVKDVDAIQHLAAPTTMLGYSDPYDDINPTVIVMVGILHSAKDAPNVKRIVVVAYSAENILSDSEKAAWAFYREYEKQLSWDLIVICFPCVFGPLHKSLLAPDQLSLSSKAFYDLLVGESVQQAITVNLSYVDVRDLALELVKSINVAEARGERIIISARHFTHQEWHK